MPSSTYPHITDDMLSAYIDGVSTEDEKNLIERVVAADAEVAWRLSSLRQTVSYLNGLPELAPPRSFALPLDRYAISEVASAESAISTTEPVPEPVPLAPRRGRAAQADAARGRVQERSWWPSLQDLFQGGGLRLSNAMIASAALVLLLIGGGIFFSDLVRQNRSMLNGVADTSSQNSSVNTTQTAAGSATALLDESAADAIAIEQVEDASEESETLSSGPILTPLPSETAVSVAVVPTATRTATSQPPETETVPIVPTATSTAIPTIIPTAQTDAPAARAVVNPQVTPAEPLTKPTALPTPEMSLAQDAAPLNQAAQSDRAAPASALGPAGPQGPPANAAVVNDYAKTDAAETDAAEIDVAPLKAAAIPQSDLASDVEAPTSAELEDVANVEASTIVTMPELEQADAVSPSSRRVMNIGTEQQSTEQEGAEQQSAEQESTTSEQSVQSTELITIIQASAQESAPILSSQGTELTVDVSTLQVEEDADTGALLGQILVRTSDGSFRPATLSAIRLIKIEPNNATTVVDGPVDTNGVFIIMDLVPGKYALEGNDAGNLFKLPSPDDDGQELHVIINAKEQLNLGMIFYEKLP